MQHSEASIFEPVPDGAAHAEPRIRRANGDDIPALEHPIGPAVMGLQSRDYDERVLVGALRSNLLALDPDLIADGTYFVAEMEGRIVGGGGWSRRRKIVNDGQGAGADDLLDPATEAAKIRAFYVHPERARLGIGSRLLRASEEAARRAGFRRLELVSTLTGAPFYAARGWCPHERLKIPDGQAYPALRMTRAFAGLPGPCRLRTTKQRNG